MKIALPVASGRISTAFDSVRLLPAVELHQGSEIARTEFPLDEELPLHRARRLKALGISLVIGGAASRSLAERLGWTHIEIIPFVSGPVDQALAA